MIPRIEEKIEVCPRMYPDVLAWLGGKGFKAAYPQRTVNSIYFDNRNLQSLSDVQEGLVPRQKVRIRYYGDHKMVPDGSFAFESKLTTEFGRSKSISSSIDFNKACRSGIYTKSYGLCMPIVKISYIREYFEIDGLRVTFDREITYEKIGYSRFLHDKAVDESNVLEIKTSAGQDSYLLRYFFDFPRTRFSKYERAFEHLVLIQ